LFCAFLTMPHYHSLNNQNATTNTTLQVSMEMKMYVVRTQKQFKSFRKTHENEHVYSPVLKMYVSHMIKGVTLNLRHYDKLDMCR
jgi:hypothetical protein